MVPFFKEFMSTLLPSLLLSFTPSIHPSIHQIFTTIILSARPELQRDPCSVARKWVTAEISGMVPCSVGDATPSRHELRALGTLRSRDLPGCGIKKAS